MNELIRVTQLPVIEEQLRTMKERVDQMVSEALSLVCNEETVQVVKAARTDLNKQFAELEEQRKAVKAAVLGPYNQFEAVYKDCVSDRFKSADSDLKQKISDVESELKVRCEAGLRDYFQELCEAHHISFLRYEQTGTIVDMASAKAKTPKKLRDQLQQFVEKVSQDMNLISSLDNCEEIMVEFQRCLDATGAIAIVQDRLRRKEEAKAEQARRSAEKSVETETAKRVEAFAPPVAQPQPKRVRVTFTVTDTLERVKLLKQFLVSNGYKYE